VWAVLAMGVIIGICNLAMGWAIWKIAQSATS
jgi:hypothetical protein